MYWINSCWQRSSLKYEIQIASWTCHLSHRNERGTTTCSTSRKSHKFRFELSNCYNNIIDFHVIYGDMKSIFMEHPFDVKYGQQFKMHFHAYIFCFFAFSLHNNERNIFMCGVFFSRTRDEANIGVEKRRFAAKFMFCECFYAKAFYCYLQRMKLERGKKKNVGKSFISFKWIILKNMYLISCLYKQWKFKLVKYEFEIK